MRQLEGFHGRLCHFGLRMGAGRQSVDSVTQIVPENGLGHLRAARIASTQYKNRLIVGHSLFGGVGVDCWNEHLNLIPTTQGVGKHLRWEREEFRLDNSLLALMGQNILDKFASQPFKRLAWFLIYINIQKTG